MTWKTINLADPVQQNRTIPAGIPSQIKNNTEYIAETRGLQSGFFYPGHAVQSVTSFTNSTSLDPDDLDGPFTNILGTPALDREQRGLTFSTPIDNPIAFPIAINLPSKTRYIDVMLTYEISGSANMEVKGHINNQRSPFITTVTTWWEYPGINSNPYITGSFLNSVKSLDSYKSLAPYTTGSVRYSMITLDLENRIDAQLPSFASEEERNNSLYMDQAILNLIFRSNIDPTTPDFTLPLDSSIGYNINDSLFKLTFDGPASIVGNTNPGPFHYSIKIPGIVLNSDTTPQVLNDAYLYCKNRDYSYVSKGGGLYQYIINFYNQNFFGSSTTQANALPNIKSLLSRIQNRANAGASLEFYNNSVMHLYGVQYRTRSQ